jgi:hypothetical protein
MIKLRPRLPELGRGRNPSKTNQQPKIKNPLTGCNSWGKAGGGWAWDA